MIRVNIATPQRSYEALIENGLLGAAGERLSKVLGAGRRLLDDQQAR